MGDMSLFGGNLSVNSYFQRSQNDEVTTMNYSRLQDSCQLQFLSLMMSREKNIKYFCKNFTKSGRQSIGWFSHESHSEFD